MANQWFDVSKEGLSKLLEGQHAKLVLELVQNALDTEATSVSVILEPIPNSPSVNVMVSDDDPDGFKDLSHAYTLFAESEKKSDPTKRGRFNLGEKLVLALCRNAQITSTKGTVRFDENGKRTKSKEKTDYGSRFTGNLKMTRDQMEEVIVELQYVLSDIPVFVNGNRIKERKPIASVKCTLPTLISDSEGTLKHTKRMTTVDIYETPEGMQPRIYEMGIPVVGTGDKYDIDVRQKIPLNMDRDNVTPSYLKKLRVIVFNEMHKEIDSEDANSTWIQEASASKDVTEEAFTSMMDNRFGKDRVVRDLSDAEANVKALNSGATVISGRSLSSEQWENSRKFNSTPTAGKSKWATPKPYSDSSDAEPVRTLPPEDWGQNIEYVAWLSKKLCRWSHGFECDVRITYGKRNHSACYGNRTLDFNLNVLGRRFFNISDESQIVKIVDLIIHELAHENADNHLSDEYHRECTRIGAEAWHWALVQQGQENLLQKE